MSPSKEVSPIQRANQLTSKQALAFGWPEEVYQEVVCLLNKAKNRRSLRSEKIKGKTKKTEKALVSAAEKRKKKKRKKLTLADLLFEAAKKHQILYGKERKKPQTITQPLRERKELLVPQSLNIISWTGRSRVLEGLQKSRLPQFSLEALEEVSSLQEFNDVVYPLIQEKNLKPTLIIIQENKESLGVVGALAAFLKTNRGSIPEEITFIGVVQNKEKIPEARKSLQQQLTLNQEDRSDHLLAVISAGGNNQQFCQNIVNALTRPELPGFTLPMPEISSNTP